MKVFLKVRLKGWHHIVLLLNISQSFSIFYSSGKFIPMQGVLVSFLSLRPNTWCAPCKRGRVYFAHFLMFQSAISWLQVHGQNHHGGSYDGTKLLSWWWPGSRAKEQSQRSRGQGPAIDPGPHLQDASNVCFTNPQGSSQANQICNPTLMAQG